MNDLPKRFDSKDAESRWCADWADKGIYAWDPSATREETFVVDTPPPTVSGSLHVGHLFSYSHQDFIVRYQRMRGKNIFFPIGWSYRPFITSASDSFAEWQEKSLAG